MDVGLLKRCWNNYEDAATSCRCTLPLLVYKESHCYSSTNSDSTVNSISCLKDAFSAIRSLYGPALTTSPWSIRIIWSDIRIDAGRGEMMRMSRLLLILFRVVRSLNSDSISSALVGSSRTNRSLRYYTWRTLPIRCP